MHKDNQCSGDQNQFLNERGKNMNQVVNELEEANHIESTRRHDIEVMMFEYRKKMSMDRIKMDKIMDENLTILSNQE
jgi:hypothetical protein